MPIVTRLVAGKKNPNRVNIFLDGKFALALSIDKVVTYGLKKDLELSTDQVDELKMGDQEDYLYSKALNFVSYRPRSLKEVRDRLVKYGASGADQARIIEKLTSKKFLDDLAFARWFVESRNAHRPRSPLHLTQELRAKGISQEIISEIKNEFADPASSIISILNKKLGTPRVLDREEKQKISLSLSRQGYSWDVIKRVVKSWESE